MSDIFRKFGMSGETKDEAPKASPAAEAPADEQKDCGCPPGECLGLEDGNDDGFDFMAELRDAMDDLKYEQQIADRKVAVGRLGETMSNLTYAAGVYARLVDEAFLPDEDR